MYVPTGEDMDAEHLFNGLVGTFHFPIYWLGISTSGFDNELIVKTELHEIYQLVNIDTFINTEDGELVSVVAVEINEGLYELEWWTILSCGIQRVLWWLSQQWWGWRYIFDGMSCF